ncbi:hypothetical protein [Microcoleus anatoxicus]|uniref:hypothetical protein n=1 Tax=Microcoleus anatoxicus TaxID=2705319 RepID=UPI0030C9B7CD
MLKWNDILSGLGLVSAGFVCAVIFFILLPFREYDYAVPLWVIGMMIALGTALTTVIHWLLCSSLLNVWTRASGLLVCQLVPILFGMVFLEDSLLLPSFLFLVTIILGITSIYSRFSTQKILLILGLSTLFFMVLMYLFLIFGYILKGKNPFYGSSQQMLPLLNQRVEISTDNPHQLQWNGKIGELTHIGRYEVTVKVDAVGDEQLVWPYVYVWWQDIKAAPLENLN